MTSNRSIRLALAALLVAGSAALSGCTGTSVPAPTAEQTVKAACDKMATAVTSLSDNMSGITQGILTDPAAAATSLATVTDAFSAGSAEVTNSTVKPLADEVVRALTAFSDDVSAVATKAEAADPQRFVTETTDLQNALTDLGKGCS
ncbi:hypothetical protein [Herbiconiux ginsengi]|uniref:Uncharacterized protein n=1 Tax=Herbiconiux ginsengi TaxID=381665 RepID=A0A1H3KPU9_9MICO|nr:hypothetical protein [Herbiconiux ginsengi]SDY54172.1 hypothetical protein SAMN05216554_0647 [Herbiconiux ginsengi]